MAASAAIPPGGAGSRKLYYFSCDDCPVQVIAFPSNWPPIIHSIIIGLQHPEKMASYGES